MKHDCPPDTTMLDHSLPLSVQKLEIIICSDWLVGSNRTSWLAEKARRRGAH